MYNSRVFRLLTVKISMANRWLKISCAELNSTRFYPKAGIVWMPFRISKRVYGLFFEQSGGETDVVSFYLTQPECIQCFLPKQELGQSVRS